MKQRFSEVQILGFLREAEAGVAVKDLCRRHGFSEASYYLWRSKFGGMTVSDAKRLKALEQENARLKKLLAEALLEQAVTQEVLRKSGKRTGSSGGGALDVWSRSKRTVRLEDGGHERQQLAVSPRAGSECRIADCHDDTGRAPSAVRGRHVVSQVAATGAHGQSQTGRPTLYGGPVAAAAPHPQEGTSGGAAAAGAACRSERSLVHGFRV